MFTFSTKSPFLLLLFLPIAFTLHAQVSTTDSIKVEQILGRGELAQKRGDFDRAILLFDSAAAVAEPFNQIEWVVKANVLKIDALIKSNQLDKAEKLATVLMYKLDKSVDKASSNRIEIYITLGQIALKKNELERSISFYEQALKLAEELELEEYIARINISMGIIYCRKDKFEKGMVCFDKSRSLQHILKSSTLSRLYNCYAGVYKEMGNSEESMEYLIKSLQLLERQEETNWVDIANRYTNLAFVSISLERPIEALEYLAKSNRILKQNKLEGISLYLYNIKARGFAYLKLEQWKKAEVELEREIERRMEQEDNKGKSFYNSQVNLARLMNYTKGAKAVQVRIDSLLPYLEPFPMLRASAYDILSTAMIGLGDTIAAVRYLQKEIEIYTILFDTKKHQYISETYLSLAKIDNSKMQWGYLKKAQESVVEAKALNHTPQEILDRKSYIDLLHLGKVWKQMSKYYLSKYEESEVELYLDSADYYIGYSSIAIEGVIKRLNTSEDKKNIIKSERSVSEITTRIAYLKSKINNTTDNIAKALHAMEDNKSIILQSILREQDINQIIGLPDSIQLVKESLQKSIAVLQKKIIDAKGERKENLLFDLEEELFVANRALKQLQLKIAKTYPKYKILLGTKDSVLTVEQIRQNLLKEHSALIEYLVTDKTTYQLIITKSEVAILDLELKKELLDSLITDFRKSISDYAFITEEATAAKKLYSTTAFRLYQCLLQKGLADLNGINQLIIVPDYTLGHLPFEALTTTLKEDAMYSDLNYLMNKYQIRYGYSAQVLNQGQKSRAENSSIHVLGMAGSYAPVDSIRIHQRGLTQQRIRSHLIELPAVLREIDYIQQTIDGNYYKGIDATEAIFKENAHSCSIIHLAMHGVLNTKHSMASAMIFTENYDSLEDNFLYGYEIAQMNLEADLVVLSACETGYGKFEQGEGIMSLARSFMYAGVPSAIVSLWQVNDMSTSIIMQSFYQELYKGKSKSAALTASKKNYLQKTNGIAAHPAFWAAFVCIGDDSPLVSPAVGWYWWIVLGGCGIVGLFFIGNRIKQKKA